MRPNPEPDKPIDTVISVSPGSPIHDLVADSVAVRVAIRVARTGGPFLFAGQQDEDLGFLAGAGVTSAIGIPLRVAGRLHSVLCLWTDTQTATFGTSDVSTFRILAHQLEMALARQELVREKQELVDHTLNTFVDVVESRTPTRQGHGRGVAAFAAIIARAMELPESQVEEIRLAGLLHDVGLAWVPEEVATTEPDRLEGAQRWTYEQHPLRSSHVVGQFNLGKTVVEAVLTHHEQFDGRGYPRGLKGKEIPLAGRILAVADTFDAMLSPHRATGGLSPHQAVAGIRVLEGSKFDPVVVDALVRSAHEAAVDPVERELSAEDFTAKPRPPRPGATGARASGAMAASAARASGAKAPPVAAPSAAALAPPANPVSPVTPPAASAQQADWPAGSRHPGH